MIRMKPSVRPPMNPEIIPRRSPRPIPTKPAMSPILSEFGVPRTSTVHRSRPWVSVPRRCNPLGTRRGVEAPTTACFASTISGPTVEKMSSTASMDRPMTSCRGDPWVAEEPDLAPRTSDGLRAGGGLGGHVLRCRMRGSRMGSEQVDDEDRDPEGQDQDRHDAVDDEDVLAHDRLDEQPTEARVGEDRLDQDRAGDDRPEGDGQRGHLGEQGVAQSVAQEHAPGVKPFDSA